MANKTNISSGPPGKGVFQTAVCVDFITNPLDPDFLARFANYENKDDPKFVENINLLKKAPRNSIIARTVSAGQGKETKDKVFFPFFPPHLSFPVKPGEQVWVLFEKIGDPTSAAYWLCRKPTDLDTDDLNYTHLDRQNLYRQFRPNLTDGTRPPGAPSPKQTFNGSITPEKLFSFPPGGGKNTANNTLPGVDAYETIYNESLSLGQFAGEPIPRFSKKSPDLTLQGSNNTLITLGTDRAGPPTDATPLGAGSIDLVAGRGQAGSLSAAAQMETNSRNFIEVNKIPTFSQKGDPNINEGDPDFITDTSRVYISMLTDGDTNLGLEYSHDLTAVSAAPYIINKSTEVRIVGREAGSIRMIKEGSTPCEFSLLSDGTVAADGTKIYIGKNSQADLSAGSGTVESQKMVRGNDLLIAISNFADEIDKAIGAPGGVPAAIGNLAAPLLSAADIHTACDTLKSEVESALSPSVFVK